MERRDELSADFAETYGICLYEFGLDGEPDDGKAAWLAALCAQLPADARVRVADDPDLAWSDSTRLERAIDFRLQQISWQLSSGKGRKPKAADLPSDVQRARNAIESAEENRSMVDEILGRIAPADGGDG